MYIQRPGRVTLSTKKKGSALKCTDRQHNSRNMPGIGSNTIYEKKRSRIACEFLVEFLSLKTQ